jgi:hypothetical protein
MSRTQISIWQENIEQDGDLIRFRKEPCPDSYRDMGLKWIMRKFKPHPISSPKTGVAATSLHIERGCRVF